MTDPTRTRVISDPPVADPDSTRDATAADARTDSDAPAAHRLRALAETGDGSPAGSSGFLSDAPPGFAVERELGAGGMGVVYLARQHGLNRPVALKMLRAGGRVDERAVIRFLAEAEAVAAVKHENVVEVYQFGDHAGRPYLALEFCPGGDLAAKMAGGERFTPTAAAELMAKVADGVGAAHALGMVHRDLKPHNVLLAADGTPKVSDFGLAKRGFGADLTGTDVVMGTPAYMSPEQAGGGTKFVGPEADVWGLGVMLYELLAGRRPFAADTPMELRMRVMEATAPSVRAARPDVPTDLELIVGKCLRREPRERYATAGELAADLRNWLDGRPITARPVGAVEGAVKWARRNKPLAGALAAAALALVLAFTILTTANTRIRGKEQATAYALCQETIARQELAAALDRVAEQRTKAEAALRQLEEEQGRTRAALDRVTAEQANTQAALTAQTRAKRFALDAFRPLLADEVFMLIGTQAQRPGFAQILFKRIGDDLERLTAELGDAEEDRAFRAFGLYKLAAVRRLLGERDGVEPTYRRAQQEYAALAAAFPANPEYRMHHAGTHNDLAILLLAEQKYPQAEAEIRRAAEVMTALIADLPNAPNRDLYRQRLALSHNNLGNALRGQGQDDRGVAEYRRAIALGEELAATAAEPKTVTDARHVQARGWINLGVTFHNQKKWAEAETAYRASLDLYAKLAAEPGVHREVRQEFATAANNLGLMYREMTRPADAVRRHRQAQDEYQKLFDRLPGDPANRSGLAVAIHGQAVALDDQRDDTAAADAYRRAYELRAGLPDSAAVRADRHRGHRARAKVLERLGRYAEAAADWATAAELAAVPANKTVNLIGRGMCLARIGDPAGAADATDKGLAASKPTADHLYDAACVFALCAGTAGLEPAAADRYAKRATALLSEAVKVGYTDVAHLATDKDLDPLRDRDDFKQLLAELRAKREVLPRPRRE